MRHRSLQDKSLAHWNTCTKNPELCITMLNQQTHWYTQGKDIHVKLCDFHLSAHNTRPMTNRRSTRHFFSPEKWRRNYTELADIFALGVLLLELCTFGGLDGPGDLPAEDSADVLKEVFPMSSLMNQRSTSTNSDSSDGSFQKRYWTKYFSMVQMHRIQHAIGHTLMGSAAVNGKNDVCDRSRTPRFGRGIPWYTWSALLKLHKSRAM